MLKKLAVVLSFLFPIVVQADTVKITGTVVFPNGKPVSSLVQIQAVCNNGESAAAYVVYNNSNGDFSIDLELLQEFDPSATSVSIKFLHITTMDVAIFVHNVNAKKDNYIGKVTMNPLE